MRETIVTGASGFIGRRLAVRIRRDCPGTAVTCLVREREDAFCRGGIDRLLACSIRPIPTDLSRGAGLEGLSKPDTLFHLAANTHTWERDQACNDLGTQTLLRNLGPLGPLNHVVFTSTTAVMENRDNLHEPLGPWHVVREQPFSRYGQTKWRAEEFLRAEAARKGFPLSIVRLCTVYGPQPRPNTLFDVLKREVARQTVASRLDWPAPTSFIHVDDTVKCLMNIGDSPPEAGETRTYLLATESKTLAEVSRLLYRAQGRVYRRIKFPKAGWRMLRTAHRLCRWGAGWLPIRIYNVLWRLDIVVNPVFYCDSSFMGKWFPELRPRQMADCIHEI